MLHMKTFFTRLLLLLLFFFPALLFAQEKNNYSILLHAGTFTPAENVNDLSKVSALFQNSLFSDKHYVTIQFYSLPDAAMKERLKMANINLEDYIPNKAYTASIPASMEVNLLKTFNIRSIIQFTNEQKTTPALLAGEFPAHAIKSFNTVDLNVVTYEKINAGKITGPLNALGASILADNQVFRSYVIRIPQYAVSSLIGLSFVQWVEPISPPDELENLPGRTLHRVNILQEGIRNLNGDGINMGIWDGGSINTSHLDFSPAGRVTIVRAGAVSDHATHVAGTMTGKGLVNPVAKGMAPNANLYNWDFNTDIQAEMAVEIPAKNLVVSSHSYGFSFSGACNLNNSLLAYESRSRSTDINLNNFPSHLHVHSAGNAGGSCAGGFHTITGSGKPAKNNLVVSNVTTAEAISGSSSRGPVSDGRIKPEISAMGSSVFSTWIPNNSYTTISGTSMSTPGVSGTAALLYQRYKQLNGNALPPSSLIKNIICNGAEDLGNPGPDYTFGFGRINALSSVKFLEDNRYAVNTVTTGTSNNFFINIPAGAVRLSVMLTWNDPAGALNANPALVNDLDLTVLEGVNTTLPWIMDKNNPSANATRGIDNYSNIEQVTIDNPTTGLYTLKVNGTAVPIGANQEYSLTWVIEQQYIEVLYPNGGENFSPGVNQTITWDNAGITANQTVEYSLNNGGNWTLLSNAVPPATTRLTWSVPTANTSTALVRISSGAVTDMSDATFNIMGTPPSMSIGAAGCTAGEVLLSWSAVTNATHYDIYQLNNATGVYSLIVADISATSFTVAALTPGGSYWFTHVAKNNTTGTVSERSNAVNGIASVGGGGLGTIGAISGNTIICGVTNGVIYSVSPVTGATGYTWTAPPGAVIASGQNTNSITINYPGGSTSGNVSVFASNGTCQTAVVTLAITVNSAGVTPPISGGNQIQNVCPGDPTPTLTATATVPGGHIVIWYSAATNGTVVSSPTLNSIGTVTYHAASRNTTTGCESTTRTAVTLTINSAPPAAITANGPTTFCQGGSVMLTANAGTSYMWSNGATTQSITVSSSGTFSVTVTTGSCNSTSPSVTVTVNPVPTATITAGGPTTFCQGQSVLLTASAGSSWLWSNGATSQSISASTSGNYTVTVTNASGCSTTSATTTVTVNSNPPATITANGPTTFCQGGSVLLTANTGASYLWSNGATTQSITVTATGTFTVAVTQSGGCVSNAAATTVIVNPLPVSTITPNGPLTFCEPGNVVLTASTGSSWLWSNGATTQAITVSSPAASGAFTVRVTNANGCFTTSAATNVTVYPRPVISIAAAPYTKLFPGLTTTLSSTVSPAGSYTYTWRNGTTVVAGAAASSLPITINELGSYTLMATNGAGCSNTSNTVIIGDSATSKLFIMPNPNDGQFQVSYYSSANTSFTMNIIDSKGAIVYRKAYTISSPYQRMEVDIRKYNAGIYTIAIIDRNGKRLATGNVLIN